MSKYINSILTEIRESTENEEFDDTIGLTEEEILKFTNDAIYRLHTRIVAQHPSVFLVEKEVDVVADQEAYSLPFKTMFKNKVSKVEFSSDGTSDKYYPLRPMSLYRRDPDINGSPEFYIRRSGEILLYPTPQSGTGKLRITYVSKAKRMDKRRCNIVSINGSGTAPTSIEVNYVNGTTVDSAELAKRTRLTVVDKYGNIKMDNILLSSIDASAGANDALLTLDTTNWTPETGEEITTSDFVLSGRYATTHLEFEEELERYIQAYVIWKVLKRDSSVDSAEAQAELLAMETDIVAAYADISDDITEIEEINNDFLWDF